MSDSEKKYGRDADLDSEIAEIIAECDSSTDSSVYTEDISEMARRYGVDVGSVPPQGNYYPTESYRGSSLYDTERYYNNIPPVPKEQFDENGGRIVYDADSGMYGKIRNQQPDSIPPLSERRKKLQSEADTGMRVLYDADTSAKTAYEAPFDSLGESNHAPAVSDGIERHHREKKNRKKAKKQPELKGGLTKRQRFFKVFIPWSGDSKGEITRKIIMDISFVVLFICAFYFMDYFIELTDAKNIDNNLKPSVVDVADNDDLEKRWEEIKKKYPDVNFPEGMLIDYADLYAKNSDFVGWISIPATNIDAPVVKTTDNSFYLKHDFLKNDTKYGCSFMDYRNNLKTLDDNTIIYGHHMRDNMLFAQLETYKTIDGFKGSPVIEFNTLYSKQKWKVYAVFITNDSRQDDNGYMFNFIVPNFHTKDSYSSYIEALDERTLYTTGVDINSDDQILTLSTCDYDFDNSRLVVVARMVRPGESESVDVEKAVVNENPRYPQKWYDVMGKSNPYKDSFRWEPNV